MRTVQPRKQRRMLYQAPLHVRYRHFSAPLSPSLKAAHHFNSVPVRRGDTVRITRGDRKGSEGKVARIDRRNYRLFLEGVTREKVDGTAIPVAIHPSKVMITNLNLDDKWRSESLKAKIAKEVEKPEEKPAEEEKKLEEPKGRKRRKLRKTPSEKATAPRKRKMKKSAEQKNEAKGETEIG